MPRDKNFEVINLQTMVTDMFFGRETKSNFVDMYEAADGVMGQIKEFFRLLESGKTISYEHTQNSKMYRWQKKSKNSFAFQCVTSALVADVFEVDARTVLNKIFEHAPFIEVCGTESHMNLETK
jgi:hypothetical protein